MIMMGEDGDEWRMARESTTGSSPITARGQELGARRERQYYIYTLSRS